MGKWVVTVAGIAILSVLCDVILPDGQIRKYVKTVFGIVVSLVIVSPLVGLFSSGVDSSPIDGTDVTAQQQYLESVANRQNKYALQNVKQLLESKGITVKKIELNSAGDTLTLELGAAYTSEFNTIVEQVAGAYFPKAKLVTIWSSL